MCLESSYSRIVDTIVILCYDYIMSLENLLSFIIKILFYYGLFFALYELFMNSIRNQTVHNNSNNKLYSYSKYTNINSKS